MLPRIGRTHFDALRDLETRWNLEAREEPFAVVPRRKMFRIRRLQEHIFIQVESARAGGRQLDDARTAEALQLVGLQLDRAQFPALRIRHGDFIVEVILAGQADRHGAELHVDILGDKKGWCGLLLLQGQSGSNNPVIHAVVIREDLHEPLHACRLAALLEEIVHKNPHRASAGGGSATRDAHGIMPENSAQEPMRLARVCATFALLVFEIVQLGEHIHRNKNMVVLKAVQTIRVVEEDIGIEHEIFDSSRCTGAVGRCQFGKEDALFFRAFGGFGSVHCEGGWKRQNQYIPRGACVTMEEVDVKKIGRPRDSCGKKMPHP